jgi:hypothetical protein
MLYIASSSLERRIAYSSTLFSQITRRLNILWRSIFDIETKKEGINELETTITKKSKEKSKDIVKLDKIIYAFN